MNGHRLRLSHTATIYGGINVISSTNWQVALESNVYVNGLIVSNALYGFLIDVLSKYERFSCHELFIPLVRSGIFSLHQTYLALLYCCLVFKWLALFYRKNGFVHSKCTRNYWMTKPEKTITRINNINENRFKRMKNGRNNVDIQWQYQNLNESIAFECVPFKLTIMLYNNYDCKQLLRSIQTYYDNWFPFSLSFFDGKLNEIWSGLGNNIL